MLIYTPRPGSKTEAAVEYLRAHGGRATAIDIAEAIDTERKNLHATFAAAIGAGLIEAWELTDGAGYALCEETAKPRAPAPAHDRAQNLADLVGTVAAVPARRGRSVVDGDPAKAKRTPRAMAKRPRLPDAPESKAAPRRVKASPPPATPSVDMRCGMFNDGSLRIEAGDSDVKVRFFEEDSNNGVFTFTPAAAAVLIDYVKGLPS
jgi:hypothetical protein